METMLKLIGGAIPGILWPALAFLVGLAIGCAVGWNKGRDQF